MGYRVAVLKLRAARTSGSTDIAKTPSRLPRPCGPGVSTPRFVFPPRVDERLALSPLWPLRRLHLARQPRKYPWGESEYFAFLRGLTEVGLMGFSHPDQMLGFGAKDVLAKLADTDLVPDDTAAYYDFEALYTNFPITLSRGERVLKQNRGSTGEGIWHVEVNDPRSFPVGQPLPMDTVLKCTEAVDNHVEEFTLGDFLMFCVQYVLGESGMIVDMRFMPRIVEGEIRILMVGEKPMFVVHKKPAASPEGAFSATLFSGAKYTYDKPENWSELVDHFQAEFPKVKERLGDFEAPLIWTADFMLDTLPDGSDGYVLGEFNCSCVGFTSNLDEGIQEAIADEVISQLTARGPGVADTESVFPRVGFRGLAIASPSGRRTLF